MFDKILRHALTLPTSIMSLISFVVSGIGIIGPLPKARGELQYIMVTIDYLTKSADAKALHHITHDKAIKFVNEDIVTHFGIPRVMISKYGTQFLGTKFIKYLSDTGVRHKKSFICHPQ